MEAMGVLELVHMVQKDIKLGNKALQLRGPKTIHYHTQWSLEVDLLNSRAVIRFLSGEEEKEMVLQNEEVEDGAGARERKKKKDRVTRRGKPDLYH